MHSQLVNNVSSHFKEFQSRQEIAYSRRLVGKKQIGILKQTTYKALSSPAATPPFLGVTNLKTAITTENTGLLVSDTTNIIHPQVMNQQLDDGGTIRLRYLEIISPLYCSFKKAFNNQMLTYAFSTIFITGSSRDGLPIHSDLFDSLLIQLSGAKKWSVWSKTSKEHDLPHLVINLTAGDALYIPNGYFHAATTSSTECPSVHVTIAVHPSS